MAKVFKAIEELPHTLLTVCLFCGRDTEKTQICLQELNTLGSDLNIICFCPPEFEQKKLAVQQGNTQNLYFFPVNSEEDWLISVNIAASKMHNPNKHAFLLFWNSSILPQQGCFKTMLSYLEQHPEILGINPVLLAPPFPTTELNGYLRVHSLGCVVDSQTQIHPLYEGLPANSPLVEKTRFFQMACPDALLVRLQDFLELDGLRPEMDRLSGYDFCLRLASLRKGLFATVHSAKAVHLDHFETWRTCGLWNSLTRLGRLPPDLLQPDYHLKVQADGLDYDLNEWLIEKPANLDFAPYQTTLEQAWCKWRCEQSPDTLLQLLSLLPSQELNLVLRYIQELPVSLPRTFVWYFATANKILRFATEHHLAHLATRAQEWLATAKRFHYLLRSKMRTLRQVGLYHCSMDKTSAIYDAWIELKEAEVLRNLTQTATSGVEWPEIAVILPVYNPQPAFLREALDSVLAQSYSKWQLCIADDASTDPAIPDLLRAYAERDKRIKIIFRETNGHISKASNSALTLATAPYVAFLDHDDLLAPKALQCMAAFLVQRPKAQFVYSDEDKIDLDGVRRSPIFKAEFDPDLQFAGHLALYSQKILQQVGRFREGVEGSQDLDLSLRVSEQLEADEIGHVPAILYHWRIHHDSTAGSIQSKPYILEATNRVWRDCVERRGLQADLFSAGKNNFLKPAFVLPPDVSCSLILLAEQKPSSQLLDFLQQFASKLKVEILWQPLRKNLEPHKNLRLALKKIAPFKILKFAEAHWTTICNLAAQQAQGEILFFLNTSLEPMQDCRPEQMLYLARRQDVASVGGLIYKGDRLFHAGFYPNIDGLPFLLGSGSESYTLRVILFGEFLRIHRALGTAWQCMAVQKEKFLATNGFDPALGNLASADFALRCEQNKLFTLISPWGQWQIAQESRLEQFETEARQNFLQKWSQVVKQHGLRNANLKAASDYGWTLDF